MRRQDVAGAVGGEPPRLPGRLVGRPDALAGIVRALRARAQFVAVTGAGGAGKATLAAQACADRSVRRAFRDGIAWLEAGPRQDAVALLASLAQRLGLPGAAADFATVKQGCGQLGPSLRGRRLLIVINNVLARPPLDAFADLMPTCTVLFTTRMAELAAAVEATEIQVGAFTREQSLELLGRCTGRDPAALPGTARALCAQVGDLPLGVALAGGAAANGRSLGDVLAALERTPAWSGTEQEPDPAQNDGPPAPAQEYQLMFRAIEAAIADLAEADQRRYAQLAVFASRGPFPRDAARALWGPGLSGARVDGLLAELADRSLLTACGADSYTAHDLQYDVLLETMGGDALAAAHARLLAGYRLRYRAGWASSAADPYLAGQLAGHLYEARFDAELRALLTDVGWIQARLVHGRTYDLIADYGYAADPLSRQVLRTLRLSARSLAAEPGLVHSQLVGRLLSHPDPGIAAWAAGLTQDVPSSVNRNPGQALLDRVPSRVTASRKQVLAGHRGSVRGVTVTPDGATAVSGGEDGIVRVWDLSGGREQATLTGHADWVRSVAVTQDGARAVSGSDDGTVRVWDLKDGRELVGLAGHVRPVWSVAVTPDGATAVSGGEDGTVRVWDLKDGRELVSLTGHVRPVWSVAVTPDGATAVSGGGDGTVRVWDLKDGRERASFTGHHGEVFAVAVTPDGARVVSSGGDGTVRMWDAGSQGGTVLTGHTGWVWSVAVTPDGARAVSGGEDASVRVWDLRARREEALFTGHPDQVFTVAITPDGTRAVSAGGDGTVRVWDLAGEQPIFAGHLGWVWSAAVTPDGARAVTGGGDGTVRLWDLDTGHELATLPGHCRPVWSVAVAADASHAVSGGSDRMVRVWDLAAGGVQSILAGHSRPVWSVAVTPDGTTAVSGGGDGTVRVWDVASSREKAILTAHSGEVLAVAVTRDGTRAVSGGTDGTVRVWDLNSGEEQMVLPAHEGWVWSVAVTPDGTRAVTGGADGTVRVWDLDGGSRALTVLTGHSGQVFTVAVTPDGAFAVSGGEDASVRLWNLAAGSELARWVAEYPVIGLSPLLGHPLRIGVGLGQGPPGLLELRALPVQPAVTDPDHRDEHVARPGKAGAGRHSRPRTGEPEARPERMTGSGAGNQLQFSVPAWGVDGRLTAVKTVVAW